MDMDENILYKPPIPGNESEIGKEKSKGGPSPGELNFHESPPPSSPISIAKILKVLLGIVVILSVVFLVFGFFLPKLFDALKSEKVEIVYWGVGLDKMDIGPIISDFESKYPEIKITYLSQDIKQYRERIVARIANKTGPDIFRFHNTWIPMLSTVLLPLPENVITKEDFTKNFYQITKEDLMRNGAIYGVPLEIDTLSLYINKDFFNALGISAPTNWIDFANYARELTVKDENNKIKTAGASMGTANNIDHASDIVSMLMVQNGVDLRNISGDLPASADALNFYTSFALPSGNVWDETLETSLTAFANGSLAMYFGYARDYSLIKSINPNLSFEIHPVPTLPDRNQTIASYWAEGISSKTKHQKESLIFLKYLTDKETQPKLFAQISKTAGIGKPYARVDLAENLKNNPNVYPFVSQAKNAVSSYFVDGTFDNGLNTKATASLNNAIDSILRGGSPETAAETFSSDFSKVLQEYYK